MARARTLTLKTQVEVKGADKLNNLGKKLQSTGRSLTVGLTLPLAALGGGLIALAENQERAEAKLRASFDSMGAAAWTSVDALKAQASALQDVTTFGDEEILELQAVLLTFGNVAGESFDRATAAALDMSALLGQDLQSSAIQLGKALNDPIRGVTALARVGVSFTQQQRDQIKVLAESGDMLSAQGIILGEVERQFGNAAEAMAGTAGGQMKQALNALSDAGEEFGAVLAPVLRDVANGVKEFAKWLRTLNPETKEWVVRIAAAAAALGPLLFVAGSFLRMIKLLVTAGGALRFAFLHIPTALGFVDLAFARTAAASKVLLANLGPLGLIAALGAAALAIDGFVDRALSPLSKGFREAAESTGADIILLEKQVQGLADDLDISFSEAEDRVAEYAERTGRSYQDAVKAVKRGVKAMTDEQWDAVEDSGNAWAAHQKVISDAIYGSGGMVPTIIQGADDMAEEMGEAPGKMADELLAAQQELSDATTQLVNFMEQALSPAQEKFRLQGFLSSKELAEGLASGNPLVRQKAGELAEAARARLAELNGYGAGAAFASSFADGIAANAWRAVNVTSAMAARVMGIMPRSEPKDPNSPFRGITKGWGFMETLAAGLASSSDVVTRTLANALTTPRLATSLAVGSTVPLAGGSGTTIINNFYLQWDGEPPRGRDEAEIIANLQRLMPLIGGKLAPGYG